jgi:hypothetical protein
MTTDRETFMEAVKHLRDLPHLPDRAYMGDVRRYQGKLWLYQGNKQGWIDFNEAVDLVYEVSVGPKTT